MYGSGANDEIISKRNRGFDYRTSMPFLLRIIPFFSGEAILAVHPSFCGEGVLIIVLTAVIIFCEGCTSGKGKYVRKKSVRRAIGEVRDFIERYEPDRDKF